jgi:hypothetical protein
MKRQIQFAGLLATGVLALGSFTAPKAAAQDPILTPILVNTAAPIVVGAVEALVKPRQPNGTVKYEGYVMHANGVQVTVRSKNSETSLQTFPLTGEAATKMQKYIDQGGFKYGDKITIYYNSRFQAVKFRGKPSQNP